MLEKKTGEAYEFKIGICLQMTGHPFERAMALGAELGAEYAWCNLDYALEGAPGGTLEGISKVEERTGVKMFMLTGDSFSNFQLTDLDLDTMQDDPTFRQHVDGYVRSMDAAAQLGAGAAQGYTFLWPGNWSSWPMRWLTRGGIIAEVDMEKLVKAYTIVLEEAEKYDVDVVVGNLPWDYTATTTNFRLLAERLGSHRLKFMWHPSDNLTCGEWDSATMGFQNIRPYLHSLHMKDLHVRPIDGIHRVDKNTDYRPLGDGDVDWHTILRSMRDTRSEAVLAVATHFVPEGGTDEDAMRTNFANLRRLIGEVGE